MKRKLQVVTGAFGYSGKYIAARLLRLGCPVRTLTNSPQRTNPFENRVEAHPFNFDQPGKLAASLRGADTLFNTYWVRFNTSQFQHASAVENTLILLEAAKKAGVRRIVHISITNPALDSPLEYFRGKAQLEQALIDSGLSYAILRPTVLFGKEDVLINNIAWALRRLPVFGVFGNGLYRLQPIYVDDLAKLAVEQGQESKNLVINAIGPETFTYRALVQTIGAIIGRRRPMIPVPAWLGYMVGWLIGKSTGDIFITRPEIEGLMSDLLHVDTPPTGETRLTEWARQNAGMLGKRYASELARRRNRQKSYEEL